MKKIALLFSALFMLAEISNAQDTTRKKVQTQSQAQKHDRIHQENHLMFMDGKLYQVQNGVRSQVKSKVNLRDGGFVNPDGSYQLKSNERFQLHDGECLDQDGNLYRSQKMFNQRQMMTQQEMEECRNHGMHKGKGHMKGS